MPGVDEIAGTLTHQMVADGLAAQTETVQQGPLVADVAVAFQGSIHFEVVAPASQFQSIEPPLLGLPGQSFQRHVGPLAGKKCDGSSHCSPPG